jgi:hypothetical protein
MIAYSDALCREICGAGPVAHQISTMEDRRWSGIVRFCAMLGAGISIAAIVVYALASPQHVVMVSIFAVLIVGLAAGFGYVQLANLADALKLPALQAIAAKNGLIYMEYGSEPLGYADARQALFGNSLAGETFTDLFNGSDESGKSFALYEAVLVRGSGKSRHIVFSGQVYAWQRRIRSGSEIVIVPDRGIFNFFKPVGGMERISFEADPEFESGFEVYAVEPEQATMAIGADLRRALLDLSRGGRVFGYVGPEAVLIAAWGPSRFEPGSMFRAIPGEQRIRAMLEDVCAGLATLERLKAAIA